MTSIRSRRSVLYLPASNPRAIAKAKSLPCDVIILDLEDAVASEMKIEARHRAIDAVASGEFGNREVVVRVNGLDSEWGAADLAELASVRPDAILAPKVNAASDVHRYAALLNRHTALWVMIETARAIFRLDEIAASSQNAPLAAFVLGTNDLANEMGMRLSVERAPFVPFMSMTIAAARTYGLSVLDGVFNEIDDEAGFHKQASQALEFGFEGKTLVHPCQIESANFIFTPSSEEIAQAKAIVSAYARPENANLGAIRLDGRMVERMHLDQAQRTLAMAGLVDQMR